MRRSLLKRGIYLFLKITDKTLFGLKKYSFPSICKDLSTCSGNSLTSVSFVYSKYGSPSTSNFKVLVTLMRFQYSIYSLIFNDIKLVWLWTWLQKNFKARLTPESSPCKKFIQFHSHRKKHRDSVSKSKFNHNFQIILNKFYPISNIPDYVECYLEVTL